MKTRVLIIDDSALIRGILKELINAQEDMVAVGAAPDPIAARQMIRSLNPDVLTLDVEMPKMDGLDFLEKLMRLRPVPVVMISSLTEHSSDITLRALELGAVDFVTKPKLDIQKGMLESGREITDKIRAAAKAKVKKSSGLGVAPANSADAVLPALANRIARFHEWTLIDTGVLVRTRVFDQVVNIDRRLARQYFIFICSNSY